jgi:predicted negative regulator of RcsB-dependent stress response
MSKRNPFSGGMQQRCSCLLQSVRDFCASNPKALVLAMLVLLSVAVIGLLIVRHRHQETYAASAGKLYRQLDTSGSTMATGRSGAADMLELLRLYNAARQLNPDSLRARDSVFLKDIDQRLNRIIHEAH